ncbi:MAG: Peptidase S24-like protein [Rhodocyclaceae bacterium]|nr:Peptidase S24-like protein [Rhodocyclaceae bacterium]
MKGRISQETLAERLGTSQPGLSHWLNGRSQPSLDDINRIADEIGVSRVWLTHGLGYEMGPGKRLLDVLMSGALGEGDLEALAITAEQLAAARSNLQKALGADPDSLSTTEEIKNKSDARRTL